MKMKWFGQSSFLLTSEAGVRVLVDPFDRMLGYKMPKPTRTHKPTMLSTAAREEHRKA